MNTATVHLHLGAGAAQTAKAALEPDNGGHLEARVEGDELVLCCEAGSVMGVLRSLDDALGCLRALGVDRSGCPERRPGPNP